MKAVVIEEPSDKSYNATIEVVKSLKEVFQIITQEVPKWWGGIDYTGCSIKLNDEFTINHPGACKLKINFSIKRSFYHIKKDF